MGVGRSRKLENSEELPRLRQETGFSERQIHLLYARFLRLDKGNKGFLNSYDLLRLRELRNNPLGERIVLAMAKEEEDEEGSDTIPVDLDNARITFRGFVRSFARFRPLDKDATGEDSNLYSVEGKLLFLWRLMDVKGDGRVTIAEVYALLKALSPDVGDDDLIRFSQEIIMEARGPREERVEAENLDEITFDRFCIGNDKESLVQDMEMNFAAASCTLC